jgi:Tfp pilus assembly protein PilN
MNCTVNLVPLAQLHARARARRRAGWLVVCAAAGLLVVSGRAFQFAAANGLQRLADEVSELDVQRSEMQRRLVAAGKRRAELTDQLRIVAQARRPQPWAARLLALTREAPEGVFLTAIEVNSRAAGAARGKEVAGSARPTVPPAGGAAKEGIALPKLPAEAHSVRLRGLAVDHGALLQFLNALQGLSGWEHVELVRATQEVYRNGSAVAFELACDIEESAP